MPSCLVNKCLSKTGRKGQSRDIALHRFPNDPMRIRCWLLQTGQNFQNLESLVNMIQEGQKQTKYWLCSIHFAADAYIHARVLRQDAVPTIFPPVREGESIIQENLKKVRLRGKKRPLEWTSGENMGFQSSGIFPVDSDIRQFTWTGNMDVQSSRASVDTIPKVTHIRPLQWTTNVDVQSSRVSGNTDVKPLQLTLTANTDVQSSSSSEDTDVKPLQLTLTSITDIQSSSASVNIYPEDTDIKPLRLAKIVDIHSSCTSADMFPEDIDRKPLQWTTNMDVESSNASEDADVKPLQLTANMDVQSSSTSVNIYPEDTDIKPLQLTKNMDVHSFSTSVDTFPEDTDIKPSKWATNVDIQSSSSSEDINIKPPQLSFTANMDVQSSSSSEDTDVKPSHSALTANKDVQSSSASADIFPEDTDIKPDISKPGCCTVGTQTEFALCNSTVKFFDQEDRPPAVVTETPVLGLQSPVLSSPVGPAGKIALLDLYWTPRILLLR